MIPRSKILLPLLILISVFACKPDPEFPVRPYLEYRSADFVFDADTTSNRKHLEYKLYFTDGDGDLGNGREANTGIKPCDTSIYNLFVRYFERSSGSYVEVNPIDPCLPFDSQIPVLNNGGSNPALEGFINGRFDYNGFPALSGVDSVKLEFQVVDEAGNYSNVAYSDPIAIPQQ